ncbi:MAG: hypothetical protein PSX37_08815 [bacterium]|nr:hypothetical protein [bacterium]
MDFERLLDDAAQVAPIEPRELYAWLPDKAEGYGYLRDVQGQVLTTWHGRRHERDLIIKVNTGSGKTIDGLVILQSYLHDGKGRRSMLRRTSTWQIRCVRKPNGSASPPPRTLTVHRIDPAR